MLGLIWVKNCLQRFSADDKSRHLVGKELRNAEKIVTSYNFVQKKKKKKNVLSHRQEHLSGLKGLDKDA